MEGEGCKSEESISAQLILGGSRGLVIQQSADQKIQCEIAVSEFKFDNF